MLVDPIVATGTVRLALLHKTSEFSPDFSWFASVVAHVPRPAWQVLYLKE